MSHQRLDRLKLVQDYLVKAGIIEELGRYYEGRNVLVTGGAGGIGSNLTIALSILVGERGKVIVLDNLSSIKAPRPWNVISASNVMFVHGDVRSDIDLKRVFKEDISIVFHLAAFFANQNSVDYPEVSAEVDVIGQIKLLKLSGSFMRLVDALFMEVMVRCLSKRTSSRCISRHLTKLTK